jgi:hypothetical protein
MAFKRGTPSFLTHQCAKSRLTKLTLLQVRRQGSLVTSAAIFLLSREKACVLKEGLAQCKPCNCVYVLFRQTVSFGFSETQERYESPSSPTGRRSHPYLVRARLAIRKASLLIPPLTPPNPHAALRGLRYSCRIRRELF